ncbi:MAG: GTP-sensing pleiotropic transcriptional regulator CodY [Eubacterium sp.]|nr:GTP-sensing pleiotropic transcriptional regulator CodY [Eubacterium sp.]
MSVELLDKTRKMNRLLRDNRVSKVAFTDLCQLLGELLESSVYVISNKGKILGIHRRKDDISCSMVPTSEGEWLEPEMAKRFLEVLSTNENVNLEFMGFPKEETKEIQAMIAPVYIAGKRLGTLFLARHEKCYGIEDIILTEYSTTIVGLEMMRAVSEEDDFASRKQQEIESILHILSPLERNAVEQVIRRIEQGEGTIVTSRLAKEVGITRTVIVNALKKVESAGLIQTKSYGVKGTHIKIKNERIYTDFVTQKMEMDF